MGENNEFDRVEYWIETSEYDLETAKIMLKGKRFLYVGFMCNLALEKILKAYFVFTNSSMPPYTHNLRRIATESNLYKLMSEDQKDFIDDIIPFNIEGRYPEYKQMLYEALDEEKCNKILKGTEEFITWTKTKLKN